MSIDVTDASKLAKVLLEHGDKILNGASKLSINAALLQRISEQFSSISDSGYADGNGGFEVFLPHHDRSGTVQDLQFIHDFFQKTQGLKLVNLANLPLSDAKIDLSKFKNLKYLELRRVPVKKLVGLKVVQPQVECIICERGLNALEQLLAECGGDKSTGFVWSELKEAVLSFNDIKVVDTSVAFAPWLQVLDLSHNNICDVKAIDCLPNLKYVNLSFNALSTIPTFNKSARKKMEVLVLKNNFIEDLSALSGLDYLTELDLSNNWICSLCTCSSFLTMSTLHWLSLMGNPLCFAPNYRTGVVGYLHISASFCNFVLDHVPLSKKEKERVGIEIMSQRNRTAATTPTHPLPGPSRVDDFEAAAVLKAPDKPNRRSGKVRLAAIPNLDDGTYEDINSDLKGLPNDRFATKRLIESVTNSNDLWGSDADVLRLPRDPLSSTPYDEACLAALLKDVTVKNSPTVSNKLTTTAIIEPIPKDEDIMKEELHHPEPNLNFSEDASSLYYSMDDEALKGSKETSPDIEAIEEPADEKDLQERLFIAIRITTAGSEVGRDELFLSLTPTELREKDVTHLRTVGSWSLASMESVTRIHGSQLHLVFETIRRDRKERVYELEESEANELYDALRCELESRTLEEMKQIPFKCVSCSSAFVIENKLWRKSANTPVCPICCSKVILQEEEAPQPSLLSEKQSSSLIRRSHNRSASAGVADALISGGVKKGSSQSSIELTASPSTEVSKQSSATSLDDAVKTPPKNGKRSDSDIEIISNPSISSIEVIDAPSRCAVEFSEESNDEKALPQLTLPTSAFTGLTESSSSGSVTDSICTAYENNSMVSSGVSKKSGLESSTLIEDPVLETCKQTDSGYKDFQDMLHEVLENVGNKLPKQLKKGADKDVDLIDYSYNEFDQLDHRIKLYIYSHLLEDNAEEFAFIIRCQFLPHGDNVSFEACVVGSTKKLYVLKVTGREEGEEASKFLKKVDNFSVGFLNLKSWHTLPWNLGYSLLVRSSYDTILEHLILLRDPAWTENFNAFIRIQDNALPSNIEWITEPSGIPGMRMTQFLLSAAKSTSLLAIALPNASHVGEEGEGEDLGESSLLATSSDLFIFGSPNWLAISYKKSAVPPPLASQKIADLMQASVREKELRLQFLQEAKGRQELWSLTFASESVLSNFLTAIKNPWEQLFSVPLHVTSEEIF